VAHRVLEPKVRYAKAQKELILGAHQERPRLRPVGRLFGVSIPTLLKRIQKKSRRSQL